MLRRLCGPLLTISAIAMLAAGCGDTVVPGGTSGTGGGGTPSPTKSTPVIAWEPPGAITYPAPLGSGQLDATANVPGTFDYSPGAGMVLSPGNQTLSTTFTPSDTHDYNSATASVTITVDPSGNMASTCGSGGPISPVAYIYVSTGTQGDSRIVGFSAAANGTLTPISGSPFLITASPTAATGSVLFGLDGADINSFKVHADGCLSLENSVLAAQGAPPNWSQEPVALFLDRRGINLYSADYTPPDGLQPGFSSWTIDPGNGELTQAGSEVTGGDSTLAFASNDQYAVATYCNDRGGAYIAEYQRGSGGSLTFLGHSQPPNSPGQPWCPGNTAADGSNHIAIELTPWQYAGASPGPSKLAIYTISDSGSLSTQSTPQNMTTSEFGPAYYQFSPDSRYLAAAGPAGLQVFAWNSSSLTLKSIAAIDSGATCTSGGCTGPGFDNVAWDMDDHLYSILGQQLWVYNVDSSGLTPAPGSPYAVQNPAWMTVLPESSP